MTIEDVEDHVRTYTAAENQRLALQLLSITADCHAGKLFPVSIDGLRVMHRRLFDGVRDHAGRLRAHGFGNEHLTFGPNRSVHRDRVLGELGEVFRKLDRSVQSFAQTQMRRTTSATLFTSPSGHMLKSYEFTRFSMATAERRGC